MKLTKKLLAMALAGVMLLTILTGCSGGKTGDRLVEEYIDAYYHSLDHYKDVPITNDVPEIKTVAEKFDPSWLKADGSWAFSPKNTDDPRYKALRDVFSKYSSSYAVNLYAFAVDSTQSELNQIMHIWSPGGHGLAIYPAPGSLTARPTAIQCATRLVTRRNTTTKRDMSYRIVVIISDYTAG